MKKGAKRWVGAAALAAGAFGTLLMLRRVRRPGRVAGAGDVWARPGMSVTFRAELMPGRGGEERTFRVAGLLPSGRVVLENFAGEHAESEFEPVRFG